MLIFNSFLLLLRWLKEGKPKWRMDLLHSYRVIESINMQIIDIGYKKINIGQSLSVTLFEGVLVTRHMYLLL